MLIACVAVVSVSFKLSGISARGHWVKRSKKVGAEEGKEMPAAEPRHFTERFPPLGPTLSRQLSHENLVNLSENRIAAGNLYTSSCTILGDLFLKQSVDKITQDKFYLCFRISTHLLTA